MAVDPIKTWQKFPLKKVEARNPSTYTLALEHSTNQQRTRVPPKSVRAGDTPHREILALGANKETCFSFCSKCLLMASGGTPKSIQPQWVRLTVRHREKTTAVHGSTASARSTKKKTTSRSKPQPAPLHTWSTTSSLSREAAWRELRFDCSMWSTLATRALSKSSNCEDTGKRGT